MTAGHEILNARRSLPARAFQAGAVGYFEAGARLGCEADGGLQGADAVGTARGAGVWPRAQGTTPLPPSVLLPGMEEGFIMEEEAR
jgi:hypothetical protein